MAGIVPGILMGLALIVCGYDGGPQEHVVRPSTEGICKRTLGRI